MKRLLALALLALPAWGQINVTTAPCKMTDGSCGAASYSTMPAPSGCVATSVPIFLGSPVALGCDAGLTYDAATDTLTSGIADKGGQVYSVRAYGAVGDGTTDDTASILAAVAAAPAGAVILLPATASNIYLVNATIYLKSGQTFEGATPSVTLKRGSLYTHVIANEASTQIGTGATYDSGITIRNLTIDEGTFGGTQGVVPPVTNGIISLGYATAVLMENVTITSLCTPNNKMLFSLHLQAVTFSTFRNIKITNDGKDGIKLNGGCHDLIFDGYDIDTYDDSLSLCPDDYPRVENLAADVYNISFRNGSSHSSFAPNTGGNPMLSTGSWLPWNSGNTYRVGDTTGNAGQIYKKVTAADIVGTVAPTHTTGDIQGADGIKWRWVGTGTHTTTNVYNVSFDGVTVGDNRTVHRIVYSDIYNHSEYPGTEGTSYVRGLTLGNVKFTAASTLTPDTFFASASLGATQSMARTLYGDTDAHGAVTVGKPGAGTDGAGTAGIIYAAPGTGTAAPNSLQFYTPTAHGSDAVAQTQVRRILLSEGELRLAVPVVYNVTDDYTDLGLDGFAFKSLHLSRATLGGKSTALTDGSATAFATFTIADGAAYTGEVIYNVKAVKGTALQALSGRARFEATREGSTYTVHVAEVGTQGLAAAAGTLTGSISIAGTAGVVTLSANFDTSQATPDSFTLSGRFDSPDAGLAITWIP